MGNRIDRLPKQQLIFFFLVLMLVSLFTSRFLLSVSFILFLVVTCFHKNFIRQLVRFARNPFLLGMSLFFLIPFVSWFWTEDKTMWARFARIKFPLFLFPIAFAGRWQLSMKQWRWTAYAFLFLVFAACCWSLWQYVQNIPAINKDYLKAKVFSTPLENDHVRFSLVVCIALICSVLLKQNISKNKWFALIPAAAFFIVYLHILSARTGLLALYFFLVLGVLYLLFMVKKSKWVTGLIIVLIVMPIGAWFLFPTFQNRIRYNLYDISNAVENKYIPGASDGNRIVSLKAGWNILKEHPFGVGADVVNKAYQWYDENLPQMPDNQKLYPSSEPLMYAGFAGWIGLILFGAIMLVPFFQKVKRNNFFWFALNFVMAFSLLFDVGLEVQFGVFIYAFVVLWWWKWFNTPVETAEPPAS